jgi:parallel beta-helix repeat protein
LRRSPGQSCLARAWTRRLRRALVAVLVAIGLAAGCTHAAERPPAPPPVAAAIGADVVHVAPPTGVREADRASILAALEQARPGGTIQFAPGTYLVGEIVPIPVSRITLVGHAEGSTLRGCDPEEWASVQNSRASCNTLELLGSHQTVRDLTFEHMSLGLALGPGTRRLAGLATGDEEALTNSIAGGHLIEGNTFRDSSNGIRGEGRWSEPIVIRGNRFINTYHAVSLAGSHVHLLDNDISVPQPARVPPTGHPGLAVAFAGMNANFPGGPFDCEHNVIAGNRIEGHPQGSLYLYALGGRCRHNVIRNNTIIVPATARFSEDPSEEVGVPLLLYAAPVGHRSVPGPEDRGSIEETVIKRNRVVGAEGLGIAIYGASRNRIVDNTITGITRQERNLLEIEGIPTEQWRAASGSGIWISPGSDENEIIGNTFEDIASHGVVLEGDHNRVESRSASDVVRDLGTGNRVTAPMPASSFVETRGIRLHYLDFGGSGLPLIFVHDWYEDAHTWASMAPSYADAYRVLAMTRRGYGQSDDVGWGYDVATQSEDILGFMDALGIERAVLVGRHPTTQDMTWIAEHHPHRLAGLVYLYHAVWPSPGDARMLRDRTFAEMFMRYGGCWMGEEAYVRGAPRLLYRPHYADDEARRIDVPAISFTYPQDAAAGVGDLDVLDMTLALATSADPGGGVCAADDIATPVAYLAALARDPERLAAVRALVPSGDERRRYAAAFERAFASNLRIVRLESVVNYRDDPASLEPHIRSFLEEVSARERDLQRQPADTTVSDTVHVAPPTGPREADRASILAALEQVRPGGTVQFAAGTYLMGELIRITLNPARYLEATDSLGTVAPGKLADLVLLDGNPLEDIRNTQRISGVVANGHYFHRQALDRLLAEVETAAARGSDTVHVAPPTGEKAADRASVLAALERVRPGGTVQFAPGTYLIGGEIIRITVPRLTLLGHSEGTTLRGCGPEEMARELGAIALGERCNLLELAGARQTVRNLTFEHAFWALHVGCCWEGFPYMEPGEGGHLIERSTFRSNSNAVRVHGSWAEPSIIRDNRFRNNWHSVAIYGNTVHLLDNDISALAPEEVPGFGFPWDAVHIGPSMPIHRSAEITPGSCANNVVARNRIEGNPDGILIDTHRPGDSCRGNVVRDNTIIVSRVRAPARLVEEWGLSEPTFIGTPIALLNYAEAFRRAGFRWTGRDWSRPAESDGYAEAVEESFLAGNVIEGNRIVGAEGLGMEILFASGNRIANNTFTTIAPRDPFPGNFFGPRPEMGVPLEWEGANGSGIWASPGSNGNEIVGNTFEEIAGAAVFLEGDRNRVEARSASDAVRDLGSGNIVRFVPGDDAPPTRRRGES